MEIMLAAFVLVVVAAAVVVGVRWWTWQPVMKRRMMAQLTGGAAVEGVCTSRRGPLLVLQDVTIRVDGSAQKSDGQFVLDRSRVLWLQVYG